MARGLIIVGMGLVPYVIRLSLILLMGRVRVPRVIHRALRCVPPVVMSAIIFPELHRPGGTLTLSLGSTRHLAGMLAALVVWRTRNVFLAIALWMRPFWVLQAAFAR
jgi:branched-subunit amino acid transport protein